MANRWATAFLIGASVAAIPVPAVAQTQRTLVDSPIPVTYNRDRNVAVTDRPRPDFQPIGVNLGSFTFRPELDVQLNYTDNVYQTAAKTSDGFVSIVPTASLQSNWSRHALGLRGGAAVERYFNNPARDQDAWNVEMNGRLDVGTASSIALGASTARLYESQFSGAALNGFASPIPYQRTKASALGTYVGGRLRLNAAVDYQQLNFLAATTFAGTTVSLDNRDRELYRGAGKAEYGISPDTSLFVETVYTRTDYAQPLAPGIPNRSSDSVQVLGGISFDLSALIRGSVGVGYVDRRYDSPIYTNTAGLSVALQVEYFPSQLTTITLTGRRVIEDSSLVGNGAYYNNGGSIRADHELLRNMLIRGEADYEVDTYVNVNSEARVLRGSVGATYLINRHLSLRADYSYGDRRSSGLLNGPVFSENRGQIALTAGL